LIQTRSPGDSFRRYAPIGVGTACDYCGTILGSRDFVVIVRRWRQRGPVRRPGVWTPAGVVDDRELAEAMAELVQEGGAVGTEARVVSVHELLHKLRAEDRERILDRLNGRTTAEIERDLTLRRASEARLASVHDRRSGRDRRLGGDRRSGRGSSLHGRERRSGRNRRSGRDRRGVQTAA
jgi:hypothetical protein